MIAIDYTHAEDARSWVAGADAAGCDFPIQNLPLGVFHAGGETSARVGVAIGDQILDLAAALDHDLLPELRSLEADLRSDSLNALMARGQVHRRLLRHAVFALLEAGSLHQARASACLVPMKAVQMRLPVRIGDFTDFFTSIHHARRTGELSRPDAPVLPNFRHMPIGYHGRASSVVESGVPCVRPEGQAAGTNGDTRYVPSDKLDFELEVGCYVSQGNALGTTIALDDADQHVFGLSLVNDWSARDIQRWESQPLGPFLAKSFMTTVSPWVVTLEALAPFRGPARGRPEGEPPLSAALTSTKHVAGGGIEISLQALLQTEAMRKQGIAPVVIAQPRFGEQYWTLFQMLTHHASNGCNLRTGDLLSSGTVSGRDRADSGCLLELTVGGREPLRLPAGETRTFLHDGDIVCLRGICEGPGFRSIGFGDCTAQVVSMNGRSRA
ncbi:fumarylacetoacetase [Piscinibacter sp. XHJ-5]|uniref:fumarylacetoacetase n=1 Tax=Piscinibacter sp. XHJ-5 TaxID=3037797 RepID=UPI00245321A4|nr:fumarylacetoacetase [Piscinibacter sp. XHJ-5]